MLYAIVDKNTNEPLGTLEICSDEIEDYSKNYKIFEVDKSFRGKFGYEIKYEDDTVRLATEEEKQNYLSSRDSEIATSKVTSLRENVLEALGLTENDLLVLKSVIEAKKAER